MLYNIEEIKNKIIQGNSLEVLKNIPDESIDCIITSPPYWSLRDYKTEPIIWDGDEKCEHEWGEDIKRAGNEYRNDKGKLQGQKYKEIAKINEAKSGNFCSLCGAWRGSLGLEPDFNLYLKHLLQIFNETKRILKKEGTCFVNIGDTYCSKGGASKHIGYQDPKYKNGRAGNFLEPAANKQKNILPKSLCQIPERFSIAMTDLGFIKRNSIIWWKRNALPSSCRDRFTNDFEYVYFYSKNEKYYFEQQKELMKEVSIKRANYAFTSQKTDRGLSAGMNLKNSLKLSEKVRNSKPENLTRNMRCVWDIPTQSLHENHFAAFPIKLVERILLAGCPVNGIVLDPFMGAGTTTLVALKSNRNFIGVELNSDYIKIAEKRIEPYINQVKLF